jgi:hypothetical protein
LSRRGPKIRLRKRFNTQGTEFAEKKNSDEEVEDEKKEAQDEKKGRAVDAAAWEASYGVDERNRYGLEAGILADGVEGTGRSIAGEIAAEKGKLILEPHKEIAAAAPHERGASQE